MTDETLSDLIAGMKDTSAVMVAMRAALRVLPVQANMVSADGTDRRAEMFLTLVRPLMVADRICEAYRIEQDFVDRAQHAYQNLQSFIDQVFGSQTLSWITRDEAVAHASTGFDARAPRRHAVWFAYLAASHAVAAAAYAGGIEHEERNQPADAVLLAAQFSAASAACSDCVARMSAGPERRAAIWGYDTDGPQTDDRTAGRIAEAAYEVDTAMRMVDRLGSDGGGDNDPVAAIKRALERAEGHLGRAGDRFFRTGALAAFDDAAAATLSDAKTLRHGYSWQMRGRPLWPDGDPKWFTEHWLRLKGEMETSETNWLFWVNWYQTVLTGGESRDGDRLRMLADLPGKDWEAGAKHLNSLLRKMSGN